MCCSSAASPTRSAAGSWPPSRGLPITRLAGILRETDEQLAQADAQLKGIEQRSRERLAWLQIQQEAILMLHDQCHTSLIRECLESFGEPSMEDPELDAPMLEQVESPT